MILSQWISVQQFVLLWFLPGSFGNADVVVGVTDHGCPLNHSDFDSAGSLLAGVISSIRSPPRSKGRSVGGSLFAGV